jgi:hypothetical protein
VQAYERLKAFDEEDKLADYVVPPTNWALRDTSSWLNFYLGRDHTARRLGIKPPGPRAEKKQRGRNRAGQQAPTNQAPTEQAPTEQESSRRPS